MDSLIELKAFSSYLKCLGYAPRSKEMILSLVCSYINYCESLSLTMSETDAIRSYNTYLHKRSKKRGKGKLSARFIGHHLYALRTYFNWLEISGKSAFNPISGLTFTLSTYSERNILTIMEIKQLYTACENYFERTLLGLYYGCGLRKFEGLWIDIKDINLKAGLLYVRVGKAGKHRVVPLSNQVKQDIQYYLQLERKAGRGVKAFWVGHCGNRLTDSKLYKNFKAILKRSGIERTVTLHSLRHSIASHLLIAGMQMEDVRDFLGHTKLETTQLYTHINTEHLLKL